MGRAGNLVIKRSIDSGEMKRFSIVSVDMFGTLVDVSSRKYVIWRAFLKDRYSDELAEQYWERATDLVFQYYDQVIQKRQYVPPKVIYEICYSKLFLEIDLDIDPKEAARLLAHQHSFSTPYGDAMIFLDSVGKEYPICVSSDTDEDMLGPLRQLYPFDNIVTSEQLGSYKTSADKRFFSAVINHYGARPESIIHIGDSGSDVIGASEAGIVTCWLNRKHRIWSHDVEPDYEVNSLIEVASILGIDIDSE